MEKYNSALAAKDAEIERLKNALDYQQEKYNELDTKPSDFQIIEFQLEQINKLKTELAAKDAELKQVREIGVEMQREVNRKLSLQLDELKKELADKDAVLERVRHHVVGFKSTSEILNEIDEVLQKYEGEG